MHFARRCSRTLLILQLGPVSERNSCSLCSLSGEIQGYKVSRKIRENSVLFCISRMSLQHLYRFLISYYTGYETLCSFKKGRLMQVADLPSEKEGQFKCIFQANGFAIQCFGWTSQFSIRKRRGTSVRSDIGNLL